MQRCALLIFSKLIETIWLLSTPEASSSSLIKSSMTDFPQRRIPVRTFTRSFPIKARIRFIYASRLITVTNLPFKDNTILTRVYLYFNLRNHILAVIPYKNKILLILSDKMKFIVKKEHFPLLPDCFSHFLLFQYKIACFFLLLCDRLRNMFLVSFI